MCEPPPIFVTLFLPPHRLRIDTGEGAAGMRRKRCRSGAGVGFVAFGAGLVVCTVLPSKLLMIVLGAALILCGYTCGKR